jgi:hypothetical protein
MRDGIGLRFGTIDRTGERQEDGSTDDDKKGALECWKEEK